MSNGFASQLLFSFNWNRYIILETILSNFFNRPSFLNSIRAQKNTQIVNKKKKKKKTTVVSRLQTAVNLSNDYLPIWKRSTLLFNEHTFHLCFIYPLPSYLLYEVYDSDGRNPLSSQYSRQIAGTDEGTALLTNDLFYFKLDQRIYQ